MTFGTYQSTSHLLVSEVTTQHALPTHTKLSLQFQSLGPLFFGCLDVIFDSSLIISLLFEEWLVDRKRIPADWRKRLAAIRVRISKEFSALPKDIDPYIQTLDPEGSVFFFCFCISTFNLGFIC